MARPTKQGLEYFSFDTDFFSDRKVRRIMNACGPNSASILICLLCNIYKDKGYYIGWDNELPFDIADVVGVSEGAVDEVIKKALQVEFFNQTLFERYKILTSSGIQKRFKNSTLKRKDIERNELFWVFDGNNSVNDGNNLINGVGNEQSKVKEKKKKESKENKEISSNEDTKKAEEELNRIAEEKERKRLDIEQKKAEQANKLAAAKAATQKRKEDFYDSLIPYVERYGKDLIRDFFDYWSELNKSGTKMKFELNATWEAAKRLSTWERNNSKFKRNENTGNSTAIVRHRPNNGGNTGRPNAADARASLENLRGLCNAVLQQPAPKDD